jgi:septal ring factor EnvC (AmiA/AmiB activator)
VGELLDLLQGVQLNPTLRERLALAEDRITARTEELARQASLFADLQKQHTILQVEVGELKARLEEAQQEIQRLAEVLKARDDVIQDLQNRLHGRLPSGDLEPETHAVLVAVQRSSSGRTDDLLARLLDLHPTAASTWTKVEYHLDRLRNLGLVELVRTGINGISFHVPTPLGREYLYRRGELG